MSDGEPGSIKIPELTPSPPLGIETTQGQGRAVTATLYRGDALAVLRDLPDASVDAVVTDPPYSSGGFTRGDRMGDSVSKYVQSDSGNRSRSVERGYRPPPSQLVLGAEEIA